jgi:hypothetical protein
VGLSGFKWVWFVKKGFSSFPKSFQFEISKMVFFGTKIDCLI